MRSKLGALAQALRAAGAFTNLATQLVLEHKRKGQSCVRVIINDEQAQSGKTHWTPENTLQQRLEAISQHGLQLNRVERGSAVRNRTRRPLFRALFVPLAVQCTWTKRQ